MRIASTNGFQETALCPRVRAEHDLRRAARSFTAPGGLLGIRYPFRVRPYSWVTRLDRTFWRLFPRLLDVDDRAPLL